RDTEGFASLEDLMNVKGIGEKTFEKLSPYICL
ncbi:ComEA family DNA-binding protein, partial [Faecalibaculum rodentium]